MKPVWSLHYRCALLAMLTFVAAGDDLLAQTGERPRGNAIIFSAPKTDTVSSNLNELRTPKSPFRDMESALQKPFDSFEPKFDAKRDLARPTPQPQPDFKRKSEKELMNERAEQMFLDPTGARDGKEDDLYNLGFDSNDPYGKRKSSLDRYYDRVDRAMTNRPSGMGLLDYNTGAGLETDSSLTPTKNNALSGKENPPGNNPNSPNNQWRSSNNPYETKRDSFFNDNSRNSSREDQPRDDAIGFSYRPQRVDRLDAFKQLLNGPSAQRPNRTTPALNPAYPSGTSANSGARTASGVGLSPFSPKPTDSFAKSAGLVGTPGSAIGVADYNAAAAPAPAQPKPIAIPKYNPPRRNF